MKTNTIQRSRRLGVALGALGAATLVLSSLGWNAEASAGILGVVTVDPGAQQFIANPSPTTPQTTCTTHDDRTCIFWGICWGSCKVVCCHYSGDQYLCGESPC
jgi:hypothetical protein